MNNNGIKTFNQLEPGESPYPVYDPPVPDEPVPNPDPNPEPEPAPPPEPFPTPPEPIPALPPEVIF